jgi:molybdate transport system substrate-binding protein
MSKFVRLVVAVVLSLAGSAAARAAEIKGFFAGSLQHTVEQVIPPYEHSSGNKVTIVYGTAGAAAAKVRNGEPADLVAATAAQIASLQKDGKVAAGSVVALAKVGVGLLVRKGAAKPDIGTVDKFKAAMLAARAISYTNPALGGPAGIYVGKMLDQLGIGEQMKAKTKLSGAGAAVSTTVVNGEADIGFIMINEIVVDPRVDYVGPLPAPIQFYTTFAVGAVAASTQQEAGRAAIGVLASPATLAVMKTLGFESP